MPNTNMIQLSTYQDDLMVVNEQPRRFLVRSRIVVLFGVLGSKPTYLYARPDVGRANQMRL